jgi:hypothetical protein
LPDRHGIHGRRSPRIGPAGHGDLDVIAATTDFSSAPQALPQKIAGRPAGQ